MKLIDLSRELYHRTPVLPNHPPFVMTRFSTHDEIRRAGKVVFSSATNYIAMGDHAGTHVDAPCHFNPDPEAMSIDKIPLENFFTEAVCLDLSHIPSKGDIEIQDLAEAEEKTKVDIRPRDTVLLYTGHNERTWGTPGYVTDFSGLTKRSAEWLGNKKILMFGVEGPSPARPGENNFLVHLVCKDMGFTHMECLTNLDKLVGKGRFRFVGFPLKIKGGTGSPIRAVAVIDND